MVEKAIAKAAEASGEEVKGIEIKLNEGEFKISSSEGTFQIGEKLNLPPNFPRSVPVFKGAEIVQFAQMEQGATIMLKSTADRDDIVKFYKTTLESAGWVSQTAAQLPTGDMLQYALGRTNLAVIVTDVENERMIAVALSII